MQVWNNRDFSGAPVWTGTTGAINFTWGSGPPVINGVTTTGLTDNFSVRFTTGAFFTAGTYRFTVTVDDGARLYVDGALLINDWREAAQRTLQAEHTFATDGTHTIIVEMLTQYDAAIHANWALTTGGGGTVPPQAPAARACGSPITSTARIWLARSCSRPRTRQRAELNWYGCAGRASSGR